MQICSQFCLKFGINLYISKRDWRVVPISEKTFLLMLTEGWSRSSWPELGKGNLWLMQELKMEATKIIDFSGSQANP